MGDMYCSKCGEPWDAYGVLQALKGEDGDMTKEEAERFMRGEGCPVCGFGSYCPSCKGTGKCRFCDGTGIEKIRHCVLDDWIESERTCSWCDGTGKCYRCGGTGELKPRKEYEDAYYDGLLEIDGEIDVIDYLP